MAETDVKHSAEGPSSLLLEGRLVRVRNRNILFCPRLHSAFVLSDTAADIWRGLERGEAPETISLKMETHGVKWREANSYVQAALETWERVGLIHSAPSGVIPFSGESVVQLVAVGNLCVRIVYPAKFAFPTALVFRHLEVESENVDVLFQLTATGEQLHLYRNGDWLQSCPLESLPSLIEEQLLAEVVNHTSCQLALHAAALLSNERMLLLCGNAGVGKTSLVLALAHAGFGFAADEVTLLDTEARGIGIPFAPAVTAGSWPLLAGGSPPFGLAPVFRRADRKPVRYALPNDTVPAFPRPIGWVLFLDRVANAPCRLETVDPANALNALLSDSFAPDQQIHIKAFDILAELTASAEVYRLTYWRLNEAIDVITKICR